MKGEITSELFSVIGCANCASGNKKGCLGCDFSRIVLNKLLQCKLFLIDKFSFFLVLKLQHQRFNQFSFKHIIALLILIVFEVCCGEYIQQLFQF